MDAVTDPTVTQVTLIKSARIGYTKILDHVVGFFIHQDPSPVLVVQPRVEDAEDYSRDEIAPMVRDTPVIAALAGDLKLKDSKQRIAKRVFRNGASVAFVGANSPGGFRRITARVVCFDEVDGYPPGGAGMEGDQIALGVKRTESFWNRKFILGSTPTIKGTSRIEKAWEESDQRRYFVPCRQCGHKQTLKWQGMRWDKDEAGNHLPETAHFVCEESGCVIQEHDKPWMIDNGEWIAAKPSKGHAGFHIWAAYSLFPNACWSNLVAEWLRVHKDPSLLRTFVNLVLGETWEDAGETVETSALLARAEAYGPDSLPDAVRVITASVDVQGDRLEVQIIGWGDREESWPCRYEVLQGDPAQQSIWDELDAVLLEKFHTQGGRELRIRAACIDTGGHHASQVHSFCRRRVARRIFAVKGAAGVRPIWPKRGSKSKTRDTVFIVGVDTGKDAIYGRLRITKPGPGFIHIPAAEGFGSDYIAQLTSEQVHTRYKFGKPYRVWVLPPKKRNEALDTFVYALAALKSLPVSMDAPVQAPNPVATAIPEAQEQPSSAGALNPPPLTQSPPPPPRAPASPGWFDLGGRDWL